jgi:serine phosphatase RsbU (regulator of sigma subunit)
MVSLPGGRVSFVVGDVSGHGIAAALLMGLIHGAMSTPSWGTPDHDPEVAAAQLNDLLLT